MTIIRHTCLASGQPTLGSSLDCPKCRTALQEAVTLQDAAREADEILHFTTADTHPDENGPGGTWTVTCPCGWVRSGHYARDTGEPVALRLAGLRGAEHEENPDKRCAYCGHPEREARCTFCQHSNKDVRDHG